MQKNKQLIRVLMKIIKTVYSGVMVEILFFRYVFNVHEFPYYYVKLGFLTPYFVVLFSFMVVVL